jgi:hypothetical protein
VLLVCGGNKARGAIVGETVAARARELCPTLEVVRFAEAGHNVRREAFDGFVERVLGFLRATA